MVLSEERLAVNEKSVQTVVTEDTTKSVGAQAAVLGKQNVAFNEKSVQVGPSGATRVSPDISQTNATHAFIDRPHTVQEADPDNGMDIDGAPSSQTYDQPSSQSVLVEDVIRNPPVPPEPPRNYAPPVTEGRGYLPENAPEPLDEVRGEDGRRPWYVVPKSKRPGIYASL